jgi:hypothetical protein
MTLIPALLVPLLLSACASPETIQRRKLEAVDRRRDSGLAYVGTCKLTTPPDVCVDFYANITTTMKKFALKNCEIVTEQCDRTAAGSICLSPAQKGDALIQYEFVFPRATDAAVLERECNPTQKRELLPL